MDCDFVQILPEIGELFDAVTPGRDGAIGSRFSHESVMINYPFFKTLCNRVCHLLVKLHDISKTLKLYSAEIFKCIAIEERHFAGNAEQTEGAAGRLRHRGGPGLLDQWDDRHGQLLVPDRDGGAELPGHARAGALHRLAR
jgi:hypothetical protein